MTTRQLLSLDEALGGLPLSKCDTMTAARRRAAAVVEFDRDGRQKSRLSVAGQKQLKQELGDAHRVLAADGKITSEELRQRGVGFLRR